MVHRVGRFVKNVDGIVGAERDQIVRHCKAMNRILTRLGEIRDLKEDATLGVTVRCKDRVSTFLPSTEGENFS